MSVRSALKLSSVLAACLVLSVPTGAAAHSSRGKIHQFLRNLQDRQGKVLVGKNNARRDLETLQDAADRGGDYRLKGTFNLGETGSISITKDVSFRSQKDRDCDRATIVGGAWPFYSHTPTTVTGEGPEIAVRDIEFDGPAGGALLVGYASEVRFSGNSVHNVRPLAIGTAYTRASGVVISTRDALGGAATFVPGAVTGEVRIQDNDIDLTVDSPTTVNGVGIVIQFADAVEGVVRGNTVLNYSRNCADALDNRAGEVVFSDNYCDSAPTGVPFPTARTPNGIVVGWFFDAPAVNMANPALNTHYEILRNYIRVDGASSFGTGAIIPGAVVADNDIVVGGGATAVGILTIGPGSLYQNNRITGSGQAAVLVANSLPGVIANGNTYDHNDSTGFTPTQAHYFLAPNTTNNVVIAPSGTVINLGTNNTVIP